MSPRSRDEPVRLTRIYTRGGDAGETSLGDGSRVSKLDSRIAAFGAVDELNALLGLVLAAGELPGRFRPWLERIQNELFDVGADLATPGDDPRALRAVQSQIDRLEREIDAMNEHLEPLASFILPGGAPTSAWLHLARTVVRRAERLAVEAGAAEPINPLAISYLNRLSDHLFVLARAENGANGDVLWIPGASR